MKGNRFLTTTDYYEIITKEALSQIVKEGQEDKFRLAEESAEMSIIEYLTENYEIEQVLEEGKSIREYDRRINYPVGSYIDVDGIPYKVIKSISGYRSPSLYEYWEEYIEYDEINDAERVQEYRQLATYYPEDLVVFNGKYYICIRENGYDFGEIRIPGITAWAEISVSDWQPIAYNINHVCLYNDVYYMLYAIEDYDETIAPDYLPTCWGEILEYDPEYNEYLLSDIEYVIFNGRVFYPVINVNSDVVEVGVNIVASDPRHKNVKKHMVRLALYELTKNIAPNSVSVVRKEDYEESMDWLCRANKMKINPMIPRKIDDTGRPNVDWGIATFQKSYDPYSNPWQV